MPTFNGSDAHEWVENLSAEDLCKLGRFNLRTLAGALGLFDTLENKYEFMSKHLEEQARYLKKQFGPSPLVREVMEAVQERKETLRVILASIRFSRKRNRR